MQYVIGPKIPPTTTILEFPVYRLYEFKPVKTINYVACFFTQTIQTTLINLTSLNFLTTLTLHLTFFDLFYPRLTALTRLTKLARPKTLIST